MGGRAPETRNFWLREFRWSLHRCGTGLRAIPGVTPRESELVSWCLFHDLPRRTVCNTPQIGNDEAYGPAQPAPKPDDDTRAREKRSLMVWTFFRGLAEGITSSESEGDSGRPGDDDNPYFAKSGTYWHWQCECGGHSRGGDLARCRRNRSQGRMESSEGHIQYALQRPVDPVSPCLVFPSPAVPTSRVEDNRS